MQREEENGFLCLVASSRLFTHDQISYRYYSSFAHDVISRVWAPSWLILQITLE